MDRINGLSDDVLVKILTFLPTKVAISTCVLSKRWKFLWMWLQTLEYMCREPESKEFIDKNLPLHRALVIERVYIDVSSDSNIEPKDYQRWIRILVSRHIRVLIIYHYLIHGRNILPSSLYTCNSLVSLILKGPILLNVPRRVCLPSLKTLGLEGGTDVTNRFLKRLLSNCPVLENLVVDRFGCDGMRKLTVIVPSLQRLTLFLTNDLDEFVLNTPALKQLRFRFHFSNCHFSMIEKMPELRKALVEIKRFSNIDSLIASISSAEHLFICPPLEAVYSDGFVFNKLKHLKICECKAYSSSFLVRLLKGSPKLQVLESSRMLGHGPDFKDDKNDWNPPTTVPQCILSSLEIVKWFRYLGRSQERDLVTYILKNGRRLKAVTINSKPYYMETHDMFKELALCARASTTCKLVFT
ncbi:FBD-associated F-box protein At4g10400-like [Capsella rubella]|uniref:FBD-associated F-box protein At4g10400-like n=1 Tax=Capsella rubella TaxID=81985 RepID=UPI000CD5612E|nr:FBD-associated F-box protein At4g10400-like [Capsella rubella]